MLIINFTNKTKRLKKALDWRFRGAKYDDEGTGHRRCGVYRAGLFFFLFTNHLGALDNALFGSSSKTQGSKFLQGFRSVDQNRFADVLDEIQRPQAPYSQEGMILPTGHLKEYCQAFCIHLKRVASHGGIPFHPAILPVLGLSDRDKQCIRDQSSIMARHFFADKSKDFINAQEQSQLGSMDHMRGVTMSDLASIELTRVLAHTLAQHNDTKFQIKFVAFDILIFMCELFNVWAEEFAHVAAEGAIGDGSAYNWAKAYDDCASRNDMLKACD
ncbi:hypothetical protein ACH5RR_027692 [Cinchona calisaya]|uniref:Uncharacterized protein n=1 Tax=Cinchona calisaya TaxID=153742 RepID=A0ABD2YMZ7_9GENT